MKTTVYTVLIVIALIAVYVIARSTPEISTLSTVSGVASFLFGLLAAYTITDRHTRISQIVANGSIERGELIVINSVMKNFPEKNRKEVLKRIDDYMLAELDYSRDDFYLTNSEFSKLFDSVSKMDVRGVKTQALFVQLLNSLENIENTRNHTTTLFSNRVSKMEWAILSLLLAIIYVSLIFANTSSLVTLIAILILTVVSIYIMRVIYLFDALQWRVEDKIIEPFQKTLETLGLKRYYTQVMIDGSVAKELHNLEPGTKYRLGTLEDYPNLESRKIEEKTVELSE